MNSQRNPREKNIGVFSFPKLKLYYEAILNRRMWYQNKNKSQNQWISNEIQEKNPNIYENPNIKRTDD